MLSCLFLDNIQYYFLWVAPTNWLSFWHILWHSIGHPFWHSIWHVIWHSTWPSIWPPSWHSIWHIYTYLTYLASILASILISFLTFFLACVWVRACPDSSAARDRFRAQTDLALTVSFWNGIAPLELALASEQGRGEGGRRKKKKERSGCICQNLETLTRWGKTFIISKSITMNIPWIKPRNHP